jgi:hypothetical protein
VYKWKEAVRDCGFLFARSTVAVSPGSDKKVDSSAQDLAGDANRVSLTERMEPCTVIARGAVAQLGECLTGSQEVASSILASSTNKINNLP